MGNAINRKDTMKNQPAVVGRRTLFVASVIIAVLALTLLLPEMGADDKHSRPGLPNGHHETSGDGFRRAVSQNRIQLFREGQAIFRFDTFGDEAFWGDALKLHLALAGQANGGVGTGVSPRAALAAGLKVDVEALPESLRGRLRWGRISVAD